jgi:2-keto-4-pentenoate hydratase/2-oxohepta-3-ene-1,7-dioic acid hydratase in catechol pathway
MKLLYFDDFKLGVLKGDNVVDVTGVVRDIPHIGPHDLISGLIERFEDYRSRLDDCVANSDGVPLAAVKIRPPLPRPGNIDCMAVNYMEDGTRDKPAPINAFHKASSAVLAHEGTMVLPDEPATVFEGEAEIALVIGKYFIDGSARALPPTGNNFFQIKSRETFAPMGPYLVTADEIDDPQKLHIKLWVNGQCRQDFNTDDMAHNMARCIEWLSAIHPLQPGDVIATGTNHRGLSPFMDGDTVELEGEGLGRLRIYIRDDLKRTWSRDSRLQHAQKGGKGPATPQLTGKYAPEG